MDLPPKGTPTVSSAACLLRCYAKRDISSVAVAPKVCQTESCSPIKFEIFREKSSLWLASGGSGLTACRGSILEIRPDSHPWILFPVALFFSYLSLVYVVGS
jgi:hypothetical protein